MSEKVIGEIKPSDATGGTRASTERPGELEVGMQTIALEGWRRLRQMYDVETARGWLKSISEDYKSVVVSEGLRWCADAHCRTRRPHRL